MAETETKEVSASEKKFTDRERKVLTELTKSDSQIEVVIPATIDAKDWLFSTGVVCKGLMIAQRQERALLPVLGRLLIIAQENPEIITGAGFDTYEAFLRDKVQVEFGVSRSSCFEAVSLAERFGHLTIADYKRIGRVNFQVLAKAIKPGDEEKKYAKTLIEKARDLPTKELKAYAVEKNLLEPGQTQGAIIRIPTNQTTIKRWEKFIEDPDIQAYCGSGKPDVILKCMIEECGAEWKAKEAAKTVDSAPDQVQEAEAVPA